MEVDQKIIREIERCFYAGHTLVNALPHKQHSMNTNRETLMSQSSPLPSGKGKVKEGHAAHDVVDKGKIIGKYHALQIAHKQCTESMPSKNHEVVTRRSGQIFHKPHRIGIDA